MTSDISMEISVNGSSSFVREGETVRELIQRMQLNEKLVAVEINREIVRRNTFAERRLLAADRVEIVEFVGGG